MKTEKAAPETDKEPNAPHPRETYGFVGHDAEEAAFADALAGRRMHHAWLITGPKGLGKASLAYRAARVALGAARTGPRPLDVDPEDPVARRIAALAHPDLFVLRRGVQERTGRPRREITVDDARELSHFFSLAPAEGGMRVAIIDAVDDLNRNAANAILKTLEEPPAKSLLILVCHAPGAALATIRSRCRRLALRPLSDDLVREAAAGADEGLVRLARGRPGRAIALQAQGVDAGGHGMEQALIALSQGHARGALTALYDRMSGEPFERFAAVIDLASDWTREAAARGKGEAWAEAWSALEALRVETEDLDMDPRHALARAVGVLDRAAAARR